MKLLLRLRRKGSRINYSAVVFWRVPHERSSRHGRLLRGEESSKAIDRLLADLEWLVGREDQRRDEGLGLLTTRLPDGFDGQAACAR
jgi:hypothetical protein